MSTSIQTSASSPLPPVKSLILDAGPLLSQSPLRGLASRYITTPLVLSELRDQRARLHWENLKLLEGVEVGIREPDALSMRKVMEWAKHTGDIAVLSKADLEVLALTYALEVEENGYARIRQLPGDNLEQTPVAGPSKSTPTAVPAPLQPTPSPSSSQSAPPKPSPWAKIPKVEAFNLAEQEVEVMEEGEEGWAEDAEAEREEHMQAMERLQLDHNGSESGSEDEVEKEEEGGEGVDGETGDIPVAESGDGEQGDLDSGVEGKSIPEREESQAPQMRDQDSTESTTEKSTSATTSDPVNLPTVPPTLNRPFSPVYDDTPLSSDSEGEWITPSNVISKKAIDMGLAPPSASTTASSSATSASADSTQKPQKKKSLKEGEMKRPRNHKMKAACMTGDYAVQNVLLQMGLNLVGEEGKRIEMVKSWVLRCHACFKICKDASKKFCPSCGNSALIRASVTTSLDPITHLPTQQVHLKPNFQYRTRGTKYSIPDPKMGSAKGQKKGGSGLILREDQREYQDGMRRETIRREKEERKLDKAVKAMEDGKGTGTGNWNDPDWMPEILVVGLSGKGRQGGGDFLPQIGHGRKNPNQVRRAKK